ncbi:MAG: SCO family protein [Spirochaetales bacterium]|nr:SCO family protein [Spirochaetales bacterium]
MLKLASCLLLYCLTVGTARAEEEPPSAAGKKETELPDRQIEEKLGQKLPPEIELKDEEGKTVRLGDFLGKKPLIIAPAYYSCPMLCTLVYNGLADAVRASYQNGPRAGRDYTILSISFNPADSAELAARKAAAYHKTLPDDAASGWHFFTGNQGPAELFRLSGYSYRKEGDEYIHQAALILLSPDGRIMRYLYGVEFPAQDFTFGLMEASDGRIGSTAQKILLSCFRYDSLQGKYAPYAFGFIRLGSIFVFICLVGLIIFLRLQKRS